LCCSFRFIFLETIQKILGSVDGFLAISLFLSFTQFLWVRTNCLWSSNNLFFCSTEILGVLVGNKFSSFCLSRKLRESNRDNLDPLRFLPLWFSSSLSRNYEKGLFLVLRLRDGVLKSGMAGGCLGYHCVGGRQNSPGRGNGKTEYIFLFIYLVLTD